MYSPERKLETPVDFSFPFNPYKIQEDFMQGLYSILENKQIGIFESPTGTGKSLSLTCSAIKWLLDHNKLIEEELIYKMQNIRDDIQEVEKSSLTKLDWIDSQFSAIQKKDELMNLKKISSSIQEHAEKIVQIKDNYMLDKENGYPSNKTAKELKLFQSPLRAVEENEEDLLLDDLIKQDQPEELENFKDIKIFFCSRTHSQLSQVVREIKRTKYGKEIRCITLASRQSLCVNSEVRKLNSVSLINEKCLEMQKNNSVTTAGDKDEQPKKKTRLKDSSKCSYKNQIQIEKLRDSTIADILDIEDLVKKGQKLKACPYYSGRTAIKDAQVIMLPYQMLFHRKTRLQSGISLTNNIVIIDEAHNLLDTISNIYSAEITLFQLDTSLNQIVFYKTKYFNKFNTKNLLKINQIIFIIKRLIKLLKFNNLQKSRMVKTHELMSEGDFFNINIFHLLEFCENTRFAQKVHSVAQRYKNEPVIETEEEIKLNSGVYNLLKKIQNQKKKSKDKTVEISENEEKCRVPISKEINSSVIRPLLTFLECLTECADDGGILIKYDLDDQIAAMKFILLNPGDHFKEIITECRSIIIAGGTMQPTKELTSQLLKNCQERVKLHIFSHVVPKESILPLVVQKGSSGKKFLFDFQNRNNSDTLSELGMTIWNVCNVVPAGIVCFVPSYDYLETLWSHFTKNQLLDKLQNKKFIYREPRSNTAGQSIEQILLQYAASIKDKSKNGAIMFSVVGGKLSEGLNFTDDLGRCVIVVGLPYPNKNSPELQEKIKYLDATLGNPAGSEYYENLCMKAVNQCIGRSIRHINDYASVLLIDERYRLDRIQKKLPSWILNSLKIPDNFGNIQSSMVKFFRERAM